MKIGPLHITARRERLMVVPPFFKYELRFTIYRGKRK